MTASPFAPRLALEATRPFGSRLAVTARSLDAGPRHMAPGTLAARPAVVAASTFLAGRARLAGALGPVAGQQLDRHAFGAQPAHGRRDLGAQLFAQHEPRDFHRRAFAFHGQHDLRPRIAAYGRHACMGRRAQAQNRFLGV